jgi:broad specificity phosphatase PhoE
VVRVSSGEERIDAYVPAELKERLRHSDGTQKEQIVEALEIYFGDRESGNKAAIERQIQRYQEQRARAKQEIQRGEQRLEEAEEGIRRLEARLEMLEASATSYEDDLDELLTEMEAEEHSVWEDHPSVVRISNDHGEPPDDVLDDLRERSDLNETFFTMGRPDTGDEEIDISDYEFNNPHDE